MALSRKSPYVETSHKVAGLMLANHTCIYKLFDRIHQHYKKLRSRNAFMDNYKKEKRFDENFEEFDSSAEVVTQLIEEYKAAGKDNYMNWGMDDSKMETE